jgi:hypothetical protein
MSATAAFTIGHGKAIAPSERRRVGIAPDADDGRVGAAPYARAGRERGSVGACARREKRIEEVAIDPGDVHARRRPGGT